ncbi:MAG: LCP family protein [Eggerthellaceae bacterium]|nr:LCP family protein [Eggerthellaceae bacterium]
MKSARAHSRQRADDAGARAAAYDDNPYSRGAHDAGNPYSRGAHNEAYSVGKAKKRKRRKIALVSLIVVLVLVLGGAGAAFAYVSNIQSNMQKNVDPEMLKILDSSTPPGDPFYMVLMGTDGSAERDQSAEYAGDQYRTDSLMLLRIDPKQKKVTCVSLMRDTKIDMGKNGIQKLNAAHAIGGAPLTVQTVSQLAGVPITHYAEINFDGFKDIVDALGGIEVDVPVKISDPRAGYLEAGLQTLDGDGALTLCRSRHTYDELGDGDGYRAANQRMVVSAIGKKILNSDVATMAATIEALSKYVTTDMSVMDIINLANNLRGMNMETDFYSAVEPTTSEYSNDIWWEILDKAEWKKMMDRINQGLPPTTEDVVDEATGIVIANAGGGALSSDESNTARSRAKRSGTVSVRNGCGVAGVGAEAAEAITELGYKTEAGNANHNDYAETVVVYGDDDQKEDAQEIADLLGKGRIVKNNNEYIYSSDFLVVIGKDWVS